FRSMRSATFFCRASPSETPTTEPLSATPIYSTPPSRLFRKAQISLSNFSLSFSFSSTRLLSCNMVDFLFWRLETRIQTCLQIIYHESISYPVNLNCSSISFEITHTISRYFFSASFHRWTIRRKIIRVFHHFPPHTFHTVSSPQ